VQTIILKLQQIFTFLRPADSQEQMTQAS